MEKCGCVRVRFRRLRRLGAFREGVRLIMTWATIKFSDQEREKDGDKGKGEGYKD